VAGALVATGGVGVASAAVEPVAGAQTAGDTLFPNQGNSGYDALHYDIALDIDVAVSTTNGVLATTSFRDATASILAKTTGAPLSSYSFDFQGSSSTLAASTLNVNSVTVNGVPATFTRIENTTTSNATTDNHKLIITPSVPVDGEFTTVVKYSGIPVRHVDTDGSYEGWNATADGAAFVNQPIGSMTAFPNNNTPRDKATYDISLTIPTKLTTSTTAATANPGLRDAAAVSNGELVSKTPSTDGSRTTWVWKQSKPMASELSLISVGRFDMYTSELTLASGRVIPEWTFIDPANTVANQQTTLSTRGQFKAMLDYFEARYGPYPGNSYGVVSDVSTGINYALETQDRSFFPGAASRSTTYHEFMHQWFGNSVSPADWNDIWLNEGPATYAEQQIAYESSGTSTTAPEQYYYNLWNSTASNNALWTTPVAKMTLASQLFGSQVYTRGAMTLEALRALIGADKFAELMKTWQSRYGGTSRTSADFIALAEEISGYSLTTFFNTWIYTSGKPAAWPSKFDLTLTGPAAPINVGDTGTYTLSTRNTGKVTQVGSVITVDLTHVLDKATLGTLPAGTTLEGNTLTWTVPTAALAATSTVSFTATPNSGTTGATLSATARSSVPGATCVDCAPSLVIGTEAVSPAPVPTITGTPTVGEVLTAHTDEWMPGTTFAYQWLLGGTPITGATSATYTIPGGSIGSTVSVTVTGTNGALTPVTVTSAATAVVARGTFVSSPIPTITGTPQFGVRLTADTTGWDAGTYFTYQWAANGASISAANGGTGATFTPNVATQLGQTITVAVTGTKFGYTTVTKTSAATAPVAGGAFVLSPTPVIAGTPRALTATTIIPAQWDDYTTLTYAWSLNGSPISGATAATYTPTIAQIGSTLSVAVTGTKAGYPTTTRVSEVSAPVGTATQVLQPTPLITGTAKLGQSLSLTPGTWDTGTTQSYQWLVGGTAIDGATGTTFAPTAEMIGSTVTATVTSVRENYTTVTKSSAATAKIAGLDLTVTPTPEITGTPEVGAELTALPGEWDADVELSYAWYADGEPIDGATAATFTPGAALAGSLVSVSVTGAKYSYESVTKFSAATEIALGDLSSTPVPTIIGTPKVGVELAVISGLWDIGTELDYQWLADGEEIEGAIESSYTPGPDRVGSVISVAVTGTKTGYEIVTQTSLETLEVALGDLVSTPIPTITGTPKVGVLLTALPGTWDADTELSYEWFADGESIDDATGSEFTPTAAELGSVITVEVTGVKDGHISVTKLSLGTAVVAIGTLVSTPVPVIDGEIRVASTVTATPGAFDEGSTFTYQWRRNGKAIKGATSATYKVVYADYKQTLSVMVTASKPGYTSASVVSATTKVAAGVLTYQPIPAVAGAKKVGQIVFVKATFNAGTKKSYTWYAGGKKVGSNKNNLKLTKAMKGKTIMVKVTVSKAGYKTIVVTSKRTAKVS
jgi:hypothetical protein